MSEKESLARVIESARRLGVELDETEALQWMTAIAASQPGDDDVVLDVRTGVFGHRVTMLDFSPEDRRDRAGAVRIGRAIQDPDLPWRCRLF